MAFGKNKYQQDVEKRKNGGGGVIQRIDPIDADDFDIDDVDFEEIEAKAAEAVSSMQTAPSADAPTEKIEPQPQPQPQPQGPVREPKNKVRPQQSSESKTMTGIVTEVPRFTPPEPPTLDEPEDSDDLEQLILAAEMYEADGVLPSVTDYLAQLNAEEKIHQAQILRLEDARRIQQAEREAAERERQRQEYEQYLSERKLVLLVRVKGVDQYYDVALADYCEQGWGDQLPDNIVRAVYEHPISKEIWEIGNPSRQRQAKAKAYAERKAQAKKKSRKPAGKPAE